MPLKKTETIFTEKAITDTMKDLECTREEAIECLTIEANMIKPKNYTASATEKKKVVREKKEDVDKNRITEWIVDILNEKCENVVIENMGKMISFDYNGKPYTVDIKFARNKYKARVDK